MGYIQQLTTKIKFGGILVVLAYFVGNFEPHIRKWDFLKIRHTLIWSFHEDNDEQQGDFGVPYFQTSPTSIFGESEANMWFINVY